MTSRRQQFEVESGPKGKTLVLTGPWTSAVEDVLRQGEVDGLDVNYARGFTGRDLNFLSGLPVRRLAVLARTIKDLSPVYSLRGLRDLSVEAGDVALDLQRLPELDTVAAEWSHVRNSITHANLRRLVTWGYAERDLWALSDNRRLETIVLKQAPFLTSLEGVQALPQIAELKVFAAGLLDDLSALRDSASRMVELELEDCRSVSRLDDVVDLRDLRFLGVSDCGEVLSISPVGSLGGLEVLHAWGSTRVIDADLSPLTTLPRLKEVRMRDRREYRPRLAAIQAQISQGS